MADQLLTQFARDRIASYQEQIKRLDEALILMDRGMTFHEAVGDAPMRDVTNERRADVVAHLAVLNDAVQLWRKELDRALG